MKNRKAIRSAGAAIALALLFAVGIAQADDTNAGRKGVGTGLTVGAETNEPGPDNERIGVGTGVETHENKVHVEFGTDRVGVGTGVEGNATRRSETHVTSENAGPARKVFTERHRSEVRTYVENAEECPAGLIRKGAACAPRTTTRTYTIGRPLPSGTQIVTVPSPVVAELPPPDRGYAYGMVNGDVVLYKTSDRTVVDSITWGF
jgi:hypothetical protein